MKKVEGHTDLAKKESGVVLMTDHSAVLNKVAKLRAEKKKFEGLQKQVNSLEGMLQQILEKLDGHNK